MKLTETCIVITFLTIFAVALLCEPYVKEKESIYRSMEENSGIPLSISMRGSLEDDWAAQSLFVALNIRDYIHEFD